MRLGVTPVKRHLRHIGAMPVGAQTDRHKARTFAWLCGLSKIRSMLSGDAPGCGTQGAFGWF